MPFLNVHSYYSFLDGVISPERIVNTCKELNINSLALTDKNGMYGLIKFIKIFRENKLKPIAGTEITEPENPSISAIFLARNQLGYSELCHLITSRKLDSNFSLFTYPYDSFSNLFILTSSIELLSVLQNTPLSLQKNDAVLFAQLYTSTDKKKDIRELYNFALENKIPVVASQPIYFLNKEDAEISKIVTCIRTKSTLANLTPSQIYDPKFIIQKPSAYNNLWKSIPDAISNLDFIINSIEDNIELNNFKFPIFPGLNNISSEDFLRELVFNGASKKYNDLYAEIISRINYELNVISELNFCDYFLAVWDINREATNRRMVSIGRGSSANSIVAYCLGFTQVDPIKHNLFFERFLNRARTSPPDIDIDFSWKERDDIIKYVFEKYGYERVAMISTIITFRAKSAFREVSKVFGLSDREISNYSRFIPWTNAENLPNLSQLFPESKKLNFELEPLKSIVYYASKIARFPRHLSIHPSGIVIAPDYITKYTALEYAKNKGLGIIVTQPDMYSIEDMGLVKIDLLSQRSLGVLKDTLNTISQ